MFKALWMAVLTGWTIVESSGKRTKLKDGKQSKMLNHAAMSLKRNLSQRTPFMSRSLV